MTGQPFERVQEALRFVPADDRDTWLRIGMAVKSELGEDGFHLWDSWSQQADSYKPQDAKSVWRSIRPNGHVTGGTLFYEAKANGWNGAGVNGFASCEEIEERKRKATEAAAKDETERKAKRAAAADKARRLWKEAKPVADHPYLIRKGVAATDTLREIPLADALPVLGYAPQASGEALQGRLLIVPVMADRKLATVEMIDEGGRKAALADGRKSGGYWATSPLPAGDEDATLLIGEGVATVLSASQATGYTGLAALSCGNLAAVASTMRERFPKARLIVLSDIGNGEDAARRAAAGARACLTVPKFGPDRPEWAKDFNDMHGLAGAEAVRGALEAAASPEPSEAPENAPRADFGDEWPAPEPLCASIAQEPYPVDALPPEILAAVEEVRAITKAPIPLVASSALAAVSLAGQALAEVKRDSRLKGPIGLYILTVAESGERKTTVDALFREAIEEFERECLPEDAEKMAHYQADLEGWEAKKRGILADITAASKGGGDPVAREGFEAELRALQAKKPRPPRVRRLIHGEDTPEKLAKSLATEWPSCGVISSEGGSILGGHGMQPDSVMRSLTQLNVFWDGGRFMRGRVSSESVDVKGARLTISIQVQESVLQEFFDKVGKLARGSGFMARFLVAWPDSTMGTRMHSRSPESLPGLGAFNRRILDLLRTSFAEDGEGVLCPPVIDLADDAKSAWIAYADAIEQGLRPGAELQEVKDVASKSADNAARLAGLFHVFQHGAEGAISEETFTRASQIAAWHLNESRRLFGGVAVPSDLADAARLDEWLRKHLCSRTKDEGDSLHLAPNQVTTQLVKQYGPYSLRRGQALEAPLKQLEELGRARPLKSGKRRLIEVNPAFLAESRE